MNREIRIHMIRAFVLILIQTLILREVQLGSSWLRFAEILIYPLILMLLPMRWPPAVNLLIAFSTGLIIDMFYDTPGVHSGASTFAMFIRPLVLRIIAPRAGYDVKQSPTRATFGTGWFLSYVALFMLMHVFLVALMTVFTVFHWEELLLRTVLTWFLSVVIILLADLIFNPKQ